MIIDNRFVIKDYEVLDILLDKNIAIYGAGADGRKFWEKYKDILRINFFIDKNDVKAFNYTLPIYKLDQCISKTGENIIIICSRKYSPEMIETLEKYGLEGGVDFFVWDMDYTESVCQFIKYNFKVARCASEINNNNVVLVPLEGCHDGTSIVYSYFAPFFSQKYNAQIVGYIRQGGNEFESVIYPSVVDIYKSFGMKEIMSIQLGEEDIIKASAIYNKIIDSIKCYDDWSNIIIENFDVGISFLRDYLRMSQLSFEPHNPYIHRCLKNAIKTILFWKKFFDENNVMVTVLWDGAHNESYLRDISITNGTRTYIIHPLGVHKAFLNFNLGENFKNMNMFYEELTEAEQQEGINWAHRAINKIFAGRKGAFLTYREGDNVFGYKSNSKQFPQKEKTRIVICPHIFNEDQWLNGPQICGENYISWLLFIGDISIETDYEWYIKLHPDETERGNLFIREFLKKYPNITLLDSNISPYELVEAGFDYALTIGGSIGHEYPLLGINVVNAGYNPHMSFHFNILPKSKEEYRSILLNIKEFSALDGKEEIYKFYCVAYLYYKNNDYSLELQKIFDIIKFGVPDSENTIYLNYVYNCTSEKNKYIRDAVEALITTIDDRKPGIFYKNNPEYIKRMICSVE